MYDLVPLSLLAAGQSGMVRQVVGDAQQVHRLEEMGLRDGKQVEVLQSGSPCIIRLDGSKLCFRTDEVTSILVEPLGL